MESQVLSGQYVDRVVSLEKFEREIDAFVQAKDSHRKRGIIFLDAEFPDIYIGFAAVKLTPPPLVFAVRINFDNYDFEPLSVVFVNPFTYEPLTQTTQVGTPFLRKIPNDMRPQQLLLQNQGKLPFLCIPGIREYHNHPAHTGDSWFLYRKKGGEGSLGYLIEKIYEYGITSLVNYQFPAINSNVVPLAIDPNLIPE
jgi:hypothetical protein